MVCVENVILDVLCVEFLMSLVGLVHLVPTHLGTVVCIEVPGTWSRIFPLLLLFYLTELSDQLFMILHVQLLRCVFMPFIAIRPILAAGEALSYQSILHIIIGI